MFFLSCQKDMSVAETDLTFIPIGAACNRRLRVMLYTCNYYVTLLLSYGEKYTVFLY